MPELQLRQREARIVFLATVYHLGRPGSEVDHTSRQPHALGLGPVHEALRASLEGSDGRPAAALLTLPLSQHQLGRLGEALLGLGNELKQVALSGRSVVPGLIEALRRSLPDEFRESGELDPGSALDLAGEVTMLRRRLDGAIREAHAALDQAQAAEAAGAAAAHPWWKVWAR